jgi:hypothetical protein
MNIAWLLLLLMTVVVVLAACASQPSAKTVAKDVVDGLAVTEVSGVPLISTGQRDCMLKRLERYSTGALEELGEQNEGVDWSDPDDVRGATPAMRAFIADLKACMRPSTSVAGTTQP